MRSKLFVPGARAAVAAFLCSSEAQASSKSIIVRVNALATAHFSADARVVASLCLALVNLPKVESALEVDAAVDIIDRAFVDVGLRPTLRVLADIESPGVDCVSRATLVCSVSLVSAVRASESARAGSERTL